MMISFPLCFPQLRVLLFSRCPLLSPQVRETLLQVPMAFHVAVETTETRVLADQYTQSRADVALIVIDVHAGASWRILHQFQPVTRNCVMLVVRQDMSIDCAIRLFACGIHGAINADASAEDLWLALHTVSRGGQWYDSTLSMRLRCHFIEPALGLLDSELQVAQLVATGAENHEIAAILGISVKSVERRVGSIMQKTNVRNRTMLAIWYWGHAQTVPHRMSARAS